MFEEFGNQKENSWVNLSNGTRVHKTAIVAPWVRFEDNCVVNAYSILGRVPSRSNALARNPEIVPNIITIGKNTIIGYHSIIFSNVTLGNNCFVGDHALVREGSRIGNNCMIGCYVNISYDSKIGNKCRFQNATVFHGECGEDCFFGVGVICSSDRRIDLNDYKFIDSNPPIFGNRVMVGSGANILPEIMIGDDAIIGAGSVVVKSVDTQTLILGPAGKVTIPHIQV